MGCNDKKVYTIEELEEGSGLCETIMFEDRDGVTYEIIALYKEDGTYELVERVCH